MELNPDTCKKAWISKDARFDGKFFVGVKTTGIYCRPVCPVKPPRFRNIRFFKTAAQASTHGFRPCLRCRPETSPDTPAWSGTSAIVSRALRLISSGELNNNNLVDFASRLGITTRHLNRLFIAHLGASPGAVALIHRLHAAKRLLDETDLPMIEVALAAGYNSLRRFNDHIKHTYGSTPTQLRRRRPARPKAQNSSDYIFKLPFRPPYHWQHMLDFLALRATPGVEKVTGSDYFRTIGTGDKPGLVRVSCDSDNHQLICNIAMPQTERLLVTIEKIKSIFDLGADPQMILAQLKHDKTLWQQVKINPGLRVPGCWDGFEIAVRSITGQQVSVAGATTVMGKIVAQYGRAVQLGPELQYLFPSPQDLASLDPAALPMPKSRARTIATVAAAVASGELSFQAGQEPDQLVDKLIRIKGIGPWTAQYIAMRAMAEPDALLEGDLVLEKKAARLYGLEQRMKTKELIHRAEAWRPWRAYASMHIWNL